MFLSAGLILYVSAIQHRLCPFYLRQLGLLAKHREANFAAQYDFCSCKYTISHTALCVPSPTHIYISWLKHKSFLCKDVVVWSEFTSLVERMLKMLILMFSSFLCLIGDINILASVQKTVKSRGRFTLMEDKRPLSFSILFYLPVLLL